ncbi:Tetrachloroethene reductive dehalogenase TceA membrane-bound subunit [Dehalococcoides mccartyi]|uniref:Tetrachloroethene reductive dehalogenase TceA membrane-bound subunit n=1 Tax=Dehalococcoides mccartyi TaxID=61435 RepID=A0A328ETJ2_9CHLR|nr:zinc ribbon domain-containing protein [Dehalococcoides mccartyi]RAL70649.1 Tetrachloroethene reductive dehalogenase TceA membrane-bound subunit [Dehalococcoides mccartyi]
MVRLIIGILLGLWGLPVLVFSIQNLIGSLSETEPQAAGMFFAVTGLPALVMLLGAFLLIRSYLKNPSKPAHPVQSRLSTADSQNTSGQYCTKCGIGLAADVVFCPNCGQKITP